MDGNAGKDSKIRLDARRPSKENKDTKTSTKTTGAKLKERWLLTRKTWRYMSDAGKKLFPEGTHPHRPEDVPKIEEHFQETSQKSKDYILWCPGQKSPHVTDVRGEDPGYDYLDADDDILGAEIKGEIDVSEHASISGSNIQNPFYGGRERLLSASDIGWVLPPELYNQLLRSYGASTLHRVASKLLEEQLMEEDELDYDEDEGEYVEIEGRTMRSVGSQTDPYLDMCVQTDHDSNAEDFVKVGAETRAETEAAVALERAAAQEQMSKTALGQQFKTFSQFDQQQQISHQAILKQQLQQEQQPQISLSMEQQQQQLQQHQQNQQLQHTILQRPQNLNLQQQVTFDQQLIGLISQPQQQQTCLTQQQQLINFPQQQAQPQNENLNKLQYQQQYDQILQSSENKNQQQYTQQQQPLLSPHQTQAQNQQYLQQQQQIEAQVYQQHHPQPPVLKKFWARRESISAKSEPLLQQEKITRGLVVEKEKEGSLTKGTVAAKLASLEASTSQVGGSLVTATQKQDPQKPHDRKKQNVFKLGLKCDFDGQPLSSKLAIEKMQMDKFKTINYDKTLRNIKSKWVPSAEEDAYIRALQMENEKERERIKEMKIKEKERIKAKEKEERAKEKELEKEREKEREKTKDKEKKRKKARSIQVGEPLPQFILNSFRINSPVEIIHATRRRLRRLSSKAESVSGSDSSMPTSGMMSPRFSISILDDQGARDLKVSEAEAEKLYQMGIPFVYKRPSIDNSLDACEFEHGLRDSVHGGGAHHFHRSLSAIQASGHISQLLYHLRASRLAHPLGGGSHVGGRGGERAQRLTQSLLQYLLPAVMQRTRGSGGGHASRLVAKRIWRTRSKSQSRASAGTTSIWTPMGNSTWMSVTGRVSTLEPTTLVHLTELERLTLQRISQAKLQALNLGCQIRIPKETSSSAPNKKRRPYLLKRKALSTGFFESKKEETKGTTGGFVFGLSLSKCLENERLRQREASEREALALSAAGTPTGEEAEGSFSRKSSQAGSHASFTSLLEGAKQSTTGSLESLNLERKRPSLGGEVILGGSPTSLELLTVDLQPQVPAIVTTCCKFLETHGLHTLGIFRVSSSKKRVRQLREEFDSGKEVILDENNCPHDVATLLKEFFRDLPEPLLTRELYEPLLNTQKIRHRRLQLEALQYLVQLLPTTNRDTLHSLLTFLMTVAEHACDIENDDGQGNKMDSNNLATLFAPNILHQIKPGSDSLSTAEMTAQAEERIDVINVVRSMIDHNKELFEVSADLLDETYQHLMDTHPEPLDTLLRRRCTGQDDLDLEIDTSSSVFEGSEASSPLPRSPTDHHDFERLRSLLAMEDVEGARKDPTAMPEINNERTRRRRRHEEECSRNLYQEKRSSGDATAAEDRGWFRRREKSGSRELERGLEEQQLPQVPERSRWFKRREKTSPKTHDDKSMSRQGSDKKIKDKSQVRHETGKSRERIGSQDSLDSQSERRNIVLSLTDQERLQVPEPSVRRLSSPEIDSFGVITASLKIPVPHHQQPSSLAFSQETDIPYIEDFGLTEEGKMRLKEGLTISASRQRTGSSDSFLGHPITGTMSFQPLSKKDSEKQSHDSVLSSSSMGIYTMSPSERNTPSSDFHFASGTSSPLGGATSPPMWLSPDSGTPGLSPPNSPPPRRRSRRKEEPSKPKAAPLAHSATHTFASKPTPIPKSRDKSYSRPSTAIPIGRSRTTDAVKKEEPRESVRVHSEICKDEGAKVRIGSSAGSGGAERDSTKKYTRRRYTGERHHTGHLSEISAPTRSSTTESATTLWKRWEIIASDPTEPETFV